MSKKPTQAMIAAALEVSPGRVSQLVKDGMPTYSVEAAAAWKLQHVAPIMTRAKSKRLSSRGHAGPTPATDPGRSSAQSESPAILADVEAVSGFVDAALLAGKANIAAVHVAALRGLLRDLPDGLWPRLPARVWVSLLDYLLDGEAKLQTVVDQAATLTPAEVAANIGDPGVWNAALVLDEACDWYDWSLDIDSATEGDE